jgi:thioredoxin-dependent peroxiredoxin
VAKNVQVYGISLDSVESHAKFRAELGLPFPLLADEGGVVAKKYDSLMEEGGVKYAARKLVLIDKAGNVVWRDEDYGVGEAIELDALMKAVAAL